MALPNITSYTKNVAKSIVYTAVDVVKSDMPALSAYIDQDSNRELSRSIYAGVKDYKGTLAKAKTAITGSKVFEAAETAVKSMGEDFKSGKFYNKERINALEDQTSEAMMGSFDDMELDFNFEDGDSEITSGDKLVAASTQVAAYKAADMIAQTQMKSTDALIKTQKASTRQLFMQNAQILGGLKEIAFVGAQSQGAMVNLTGIQENAARNSKMFYESTSKLLQENNAMVKEMLEMQRALYKGTQDQQKQSEKKKRIGYDDVVGYEGAIDVKEYLSSIKANAKSSLSSMSGGMSDMIFDMNPEMLKSLSGSPLTFISELLLKQIMPSATKNAAKNFDKTLSGVASTMIARFNNMAKDSDNPLMQAIGQIFGLKTSPKTSLDPSKFNKGPVPFDGIVRKSIVDVIPTYLRRIEAALTGQPEKIYDMGKGSWTDVRKVKAEYDRMIKGARSEANYDLVEEIRKVLNDKNSPKYSDKYSSDAFKDSLETFLNAVYDRDGDFKYKSKEDAWKYGISSDDFEMIADLITNKNNPDMQRARIRHSSQVMASKSSLNKRFEQMEQLADSPLFQMFNSSTNYKNFETPKYEDAPRAGFAAALDLNNQTDKLGNNIFYYLRNMYNEIYTIRNYTGMGTGGAPMNAVAGGTGRAFSPPNIRELNIPDTHKRTAKEQFNAREEDARRRYEQEIAKHTAKGGKLYDITDTRGNILKDRATVEQRQLLEQLETARSSQGWFNDLLYSQDTKLDEANRKREKEGEEKITGKKLIDRLKGTKNLSEKFAVLQDQINKLTSAPDKMAVNLIKKADERIYDFFYGAETGEEDESTGKKIKGFMGLMSMKLNIAFDKVNTFIDDKILDPIKKKLGVENVQQLMDKLGITDIWKNITNKLFGEKDEKGKRQGGIFGETRDEIKRVFGGAKDYVFNSLKDVFAPVTNKIKDVFSNKAKTTKTAMSVEDITPEVLSAFKPNMTPLNALFIAAPQEAITKLKKEISELLKAHHLPGSTTILTCTTKAELNKLSITISAALAKRKGKNAKTVKKNVDAKIERLRYFFRHEEEKNKFINDTRTEFDPNRKVDKEELKKAHDKYKAGDRGPLFTELEDPSKPIVDKNGNVVIGKDGKPVMPQTGGQHAKDIRAIDGPILTFCKKLGLDAYKNDGAIVATIIKDILKTDPEYNPLDPNKSLNRISMLDVHNALEAQGLTKIAYKVKKNMLKQFGNQDVTLNTFIKSGKNVALAQPKDEKSSKEGTDETKNDTKDSNKLTGNNIVSTAYQTLENILSVIKSVVSDNAVVVDIRRRVKSSTTQPGAISNIVSQVSGNRESETEGDSTGESDGQLHSSAFGNTFKKNTSSALSKGEIYSRNGLMGKVPSTGVYDVKSGTTIYPTDKDKAIELADEQSAISKFLAKAGIVSNAEANNAPVKEHNGKKYTLQSDGKYHHYEKTPEGMFDYVLEDGFGDQMYSTAKGGVNNLLTGLGFKGLAQTDAVESVDKAMEVVKKYAPKMTANGLLGAAVGLLSGNPLLGAAIGATSGYIQSSEKAKTALFGKEVTDADGNKSREGGVISKEAQDTFKKYMPNMGKYGTAGAVLGLVTPFGLMGGALIGSAIGWATTDDKIKEALFGNLKDSASGLISKDVRDHIKKAAPNIAVGAIAGLLAGPFGLMGNLVLGSGIGLASSTDGFQKFLFGEEVEDEEGNKTRQGGLVGAIRTNVVDPLKDFAKTFKERTEEFVINDMINPLKEGIKPILHEMGLLTKGLIGFVPKMLNKMFESTFGRPLQDLIRDRIISPVSAIASRAAGFAGGVGKAVISAPFKAVGAVGRSLQSKHIRKGDASYISATERLAYRDEHRGRGALSNIPVLGNSVFGSLGFNPTGYRDKFRDVDETLASIKDPEQLKAIMEATETLSKKKGYFKEQSRKTGRGLMAELSAVFPSRACGAIKKALEAKDITKVANLIRDAVPLKGTEVTAADREALIKKAEEALNTISENDSRGRMDGRARKDLYKQLGDMGFSNIGDNNIDKLYKLVRTEYGVKKQDTKVIEKTDEEKTADENAKKVSDPITENATKNADNIIKSLTKSLETIADIQMAQLDPNEERRLMNLQSAKQDKIAAKNLAAAGVKQKTLTEDEDTKWEFSGGIVRKYIMTAEGWQEATGKVKADADRAEEDKQEQQSNHFIAGIGSKLMGLFGLGKKKEPTEEEEENPIIKFLKKAGKFAGMGLLGATAIAGTGHAAGYAQDNLLPRLNSFWNDTAAPFLEKHLGGVGKKISDVVERISTFAVELPGKIKTGVTEIWKWFSGDVENGGFPYIFENRIFPWFLSGFDKFATVFLPPIVKAIVMALPAVGKALLKGTIEGIKGIFGLKSKDTVPEFNTDYDSMNTSIDENVYSSKSSGLNAIPAPPGSNKWWTQSGSGLGEVYTAAKGINVTVPASGASKEVRDAEKDRLQQAVSSTSGGTQKIAINAAIQNAAEIRQSDGATLYNHAYMPTDSRGNHYDKYGNLTNDNSQDYLDPFGGAVSLEDRMFKLGGRYVLGGGGATGAFKLARGAGKVVSKMGPLGKVASLPLRGIGKVGGKLAAHSPNIGNKLLGENVGSLVYNVGDVMSGSKSTKLANIGSKLAGSKVAKTGVDAAAETTVAKMVKKGTMEAGEKMFVAQTGSTIVAQAAEKAPAGLLKKVGDFITKGIKSIFSNRAATRLAREGMEAAGQQVAEGAAEQAMEQAAEKVSKKLIKIVGEQMGKLGAMAISKVTTMVARTTPVGALFAVWDFATGVKDARSILGITKSQDISILERLIAGLLKCANGFIVGGIIPEDLIVDVFVEFLAPIMNINVDDINRRREASEEEIKQYNAEHGTSFTSAEAFNKRNSIGTKIGNAVKGVGSSIKTGVGNVVSAVKEKGIGGAVADAGSAVLNKGKEIASNVFGEEQTKALSTVLGDVGNIGKNLLAGDPMAIMKTGTEDTTGLKSMTLMPLKLVSAIPAGLIGGVKGIFKLITPTIKAIGNLGAEGIQNRSLVYKAMMDGDIKQMIFAGNSFMGEEGVDISQLLSNISTIPTKLLLAIPTLVVAGVKSIGKLLSPVVEGISNAGSTTISKLSGVGGMIINGDPGGIIATLSDTQTEEGGVDIGKLLGNIIIGATSPFTVIPATIVLAGKKIGSFLEGPINAIKDAHKVYETNNSAMAKLAANGDFLGVTNYTAQLGDDPKDGGKNPFGFLHKALTFTGKLVYTPMAAFSSISLFIDKLFNNHKELNLGAMLKEMWTYTSKAKRPNWNEIDKVGLPEEGDIIGGLVTSLVRPIVKSVVGVFRHLSFVSDWIAKIKGDPESASELEASDTGMGKFGRGRVYQKDPKYAGVRFNKGSDSVRQTIGDSGCGPAAAVNALKYAYGTGDLMSAANMAVSGGYKERNGGTNPRFFTDYFKQNGLHAKSLHGANSIKNSLYNGSPVVLMGKDSSGGYDTPYGPNPHYVTAKGIDAKGNIIIDDPESRYGTARYPAGKVIGKSSVAVSASRYGRSKYNVEDTVANIWNPSGNSLGITEDNIDEKVKETVDRIGYQVPVPTTTYTGVKTLTQSEKNKAAFACLPYVDKPYSSLPNSVSGVVNGYITKIGKKISDRDKNSTVRTVVNNYLGVRMGETQDLVNALAKVASLTIRELKRSNFTLYSRLKTAVKDTINFDISNYTEKTVGEVCATIGITLTGNITDAKTTNSNPTTESVSNEYAAYDTNMDTSSYTEPQKENKNIFSAISDFFIGLFDYTDKTTGEKKNLLNIFGIGGGSSSGSGLSNSAAQATGVNGAMANGFPYFNQADPAWKDKPYGSGTMASSACGPTSMAMVLKSYGVDTDPVQAADYSVKNGFRTASQGTAWGYFGNIARNYGLNTNQTGSDTNTMVNNLQKGYPIVASMKKGDFTDTGHLIVLSGIDANGNIFVNDPAGSKGKERSAKAWSPGTISSQSKQMWIFDKAGAGSIGKFNSGSSGTTTAAGGTVEQNKKTIWDFLIGKGYTPIAAAGIMGNIQQECQFNHALVQNGGDENNPKLGIGICQWTYHTRKKAFQAAVPDWKTNLGGQLDFMWKELHQSSYQGALPAGMNKCKTVEEAVWLFHQVYEKSSDIDRTGGLANREKFGNGVYNQFASSTPTNYGTGKYGRAKDLGITRHGEITSGFNDPTRASHNGIDIAGKAGQSIISPARGTVIRSEYSETNGNMIVIQSEDGYLYTFCHLNSRTVKVGDRVSIGSLLGNMGNTGNSFGNHVHYQVTNADGQFVDPLSIANGKRNASTIQPSNQPRAIGGSDGLDYTQLIRIIIELLGTISDNTSKFTKALNVISEKTGADLSGVDLSSKDKAMNQIKDKLRALDSSYGKGKSDLGSSMLGTNTDYLIRAMSTIAQS